MEYQASKMHWKPGVRHAHPHYRTPATRRSPSRSGRYYPRRVRRYTPRRRYGGQY